ncbi:hypothetical protein GPECTOR_18g6 [Gonium pectorale]|uniref:Uncharacterized protein n=1 Tax=Gonium pectorale TaxID=33097 RepID=A0A150GJU0_GONPE|nr:hypothetical protein GPECTOR_18g6 [Gonium pectorale]|eukprot:KXZ50082.1 hypothetical protein GPECTOR_18g6 [Gonium pectorale]
MQQSSHIWIPGIVERIAHFLPPNAVACSLRLVDKATAELLRRPDCTLTRLSQPVPYDAFVWQWGRPGAMHALTLAQRRKLLCLTATSGATANLAIAARAAGCRPTHQVAYDAGKAGQLGSVLMLEQLGCDVQDAVRGAASGGHLALCRELGGHADVVDWVLHSSGQECEPDLPHAWNLVASVAGSCSLDALQRFFSELIGPRAVDGGGGLEDELYQGWVLAAAAGSATPDWRAKVEWLESCGFPRSCDVCHVAVGRPDALERFGWLRRRGVSVCPAGDACALASMDAAARAGNLEAMDFLAGSWPAHSDFTGAAEAAAEKGHLERPSARGGLAGGDARGCMATPGLLDEELLDEELLDEELLAAAAESGGVELLAWLWERGCAWDGRAVTAAASSGCTAALEWLAERGCPMESGAAFVWAAREADLATLNSLRRLGCPWGSVGDVFRAGFYGGLEVLSWLVAAGFSVDWAEAEAEAGGRAAAAIHEASLRQEDTERMLSWVRFEASRRRR